VGVQIKNRPDSVLFLLGRPCALGARAGTAPGRAPTPLLRKIIVFNLSRLAVNLRCSGFWLEV
jgi:hypothetical protein